MSCIYRHHYDEAYDHPFEHCVGELWAEMPGGWHTYDIIAGLRETSAEEMVPGARIVTAVTQPWAGLICAAPLEHTLLRLFVSWAKCQKSTTLWEEGLSELVRQAEHVIALAEADDPPNKPDVTLVSRLANTRED